MWWGLRNGIDLNLIGFICCDVNVCYVEPAINMLPSLAKISPPPQNPITQHNNRKALRPTPLAHSRFSWVGIYGCLISRFNGWGLEYIQRMQKGMDWLYLRMIHVY